MKLTPKYKNPIFSSVSYKIHGFNAWEGYKPISSYDPTTEKLTMPTYIQKMWQQVVRTKNHLNGEDVIYTLSQCGGPCHSTKHRYYRRNIVWLIFSILNKKI